MSARGAVALVFGLWVALVVGDALIAEYAAQSRADLAARLVAASLENVSADDAARVLGQVGRVLEDDFNVVVTDRDGARLFAHGAAIFPPPVALPSTRAHRSVAGPLGSVTVAIGQNSVLTPVFWRALFGFAAALLLSFQLALRAGNSDGRQRARALKSALDMLSDGVVLWDRSQRLLATSVALRRNPMLQASLLRRGVGYKTFLDGLRQAGDLTLVATTHATRRLHLTTSAGDAWDIFEHLSEDGVLVTRFVDDGERSRLSDEVARLTSRVGELASDLQTQRVRGDAASRSKTLFLGQLSHSLRTPLNHIIGFADLLRHQCYGPLGDARYLNYAGNIKQSGEALLDVIANMLELAEFDSGQRVLARESIRLNELMDWVIGRYGEQAHRAGLTFTLERSHEMLIVGDKQCLKRLVGNIVENSLKFTPSGGSLVVAAWPAEDGVVIEITDTGIGITSDALGVLNSSFALGNESRGNGIAVSRAIAELSGGQLQINSTQGIGTTVAVLLPARPLDDADLRGQPMTQKRVA